MNKDSKWTIGDLKDLICDLPDDTEVRVCSTFDSLTDTFYHVSIDDITYDVTEKVAYLVISPTELSVT